MADVNENIYINIEAKYQSLQGMLDQLDKVKQNFKNFGRAKIDTNLRNMIKKASDPIEEATKQLEIAQKNVENAENKLRQARVLGGGVDSAKKKYMEAVQRAQVVAKTVEHTKKLAELEEKISSDYQRKNTVLKSIGNAMSKFAKFSQSVSKSTQKSSTWIDKLWGRIRNISIYRMIRSAIKWVTSGFKEGLQNFAQYNGEVNKTVSELNGNLKQIRNTMGVSLAYTLQSLQPIIEKVLNGITEGLNAFNLALAKMQGKDQFTKAKKNVDDYAKSLEKAKKLSFDTFEVLNSGDSATSPQNMFEQANIDENESKLSKFFERIFAFIQNVGDAIGRIFERLSKTDIFDKLLTIAENIANAISDVIIGLLDSGALDTILNVITEIWKVFSVIIKAAASFVSYLNQIGALKPILYGIAAAWVAIKMAAIGAAIASAAAWVAQHPITGSIIIAGAITAATLIAKNALERQTAGYAEGGIPEKSELFYMNENGVPEAIVNTGGSQTNVINIDQLSEGMRRGFTQAIYETGLIDAMQTRLVVDGNSVNDNAFARAIFPALKTESRRRGGNQL